MSLRNGKGRFDTAWLKVELGEKRFIIIPYLAELSQYSGFMRKQNH